MQHEMYIPRFGSHQVVIIGIASKLVRSGLFPIRRFRLIRCCASLVARARRSKAAVEDADADTSTDTSVEAANEPAAPSDSNVATHAETLEGN